MALSAALKAKLQDLDTDLQLVCEKFNTVSGNNKYRKLSVPLTALEAVQSLLDRDTPGQGQGQHH